MATQRQNILRRMTSVVKRAKAWLCFTAEEDGCTIRLDKVGSTDPDPVQLETSIDGGKTWTPYSWSGGPGAAINLNRGDKVYWRGDNAYLSNSYSRYYKFYTSKKVSVSGNIMSLLDKDAKEKEVSSSDFYGLLLDTKIMTAPELPATILASNCYQRMFLRCTFLTTAPELPATTLATNCYSNMFEGCSSLNSVKVKFTSWPTGSVLTNWLLGVAETGTFYCPDELPDPDPSERGASTVPAGWTIVRPHQRYVAQENLVLQLDCKVGVEQDGRLGKWTTVDGQYTFNGGLYTISRDNKGGLLVDGIGFTLSEVLPWLIEDGYTVEVCARQIIDLNDPTQMGANFVVVSGGTEETRENICAIAELSSKPLEGSNISSIATGGFFSADRVFKTFQQTLNGELFTAYFHPADNTCKLNGKDGIAIQVEVSGSYISPARTFVSGTGILYSVRVYNRALSASEQLHNRQLDIERFG